MDEIIVPLQKDSEYLAPLYRARAQVIMQMHKDGKSLAYIGRLFGISRERVRQIVARANNAIEIDAGRE